MSKRYRLFYSRQRMLLFTLLPLAYCGHCHTTVNVCLENRLLLLLTVKTQPRMTTTVTTRVCSQALRFTNSSHMLSMEARRHANDVDGWLISDGSLTNTHTSVTSTQVFL